MARKGPFAVDLRAGSSYEWRAWGRSAKQSFRDDLRKETELTPIGFKAEHECTAYLCGCTSGQRRPLCDGSHDRL